MYYAGALTFGQDGLVLLRQFAERYPKDAIAFGKISPKRLTGGGSPPSAAWERLRGGVALAPEAIRLYVGLDSAPHAAFLDVLRVLREHHHLNIGYCVVRGGHIEHVVRADAD